MSSAISPPCTTTARSHATHPRPRAPRGPEMGVLFQSFLGGGAAVFTQGVPDRERKAARSGADCLDQLLVHCLVEQLLHGTTWQLEVLGKVEERFAAFDEHEFEQQVEQVSLRDPGFLEIGGNGGGQ